MLYSQKNKCLVLSKYSHSDPLTHMLRKLLVYYDKIYFYTPNQNQEKKIQEMKKIMDRLSDKVG